MEVELSEVESVVLVTFIQHVCRKIGNEETKGRCKVKRRSDLRTKFIEFDIFTVAGKNA